MFELLHAFTTKLDALRFGMTDFNTAADASGNEASSWNYGENFGGHATTVSAGSSFTPYATMHHAADANKKSWGIGDDAPTKTPAPPAPAAPSAPKVCLEQAIDRSID